MSEAVTIHAFGEQNAVAAWLNPYCDLQSSTAKVVVRHEGEFQLARSQQLLSNDSCLWIDQLDAAVVRLTQVGVQHRARTILRVESSDLLDNDLSQMRWEFFDAVVPSDKLAEALLFDVCDRIESFTRVVQLPMALALPHLAVADKRPTKTIAYRGALRRDNRSEMLLQLLAALARVDAQFRLVIVGEFESRSWQAHFETMIQAMGLAEQIRFEVAPPDWIAWYRDKDAIIQLTTDSVSRQTTLLAMACGVRPVVYRHFGAENHYMPDMIFSSLDDAAQLIRHSPWEPLRWRNQISEQHDPEQNYARFRSIVEFESSEASPMVSILLPTFNRAKILEGTLARLGRQTYRNIEIVAVDDCSEDETPEVLARAARADSRVVTSRNPVNEGNARAMATAARMAAGEFVLVFCDDDDLAEDAVEKLVECVRRKQPDLIYSNLEIIDQNGNSQGVWQYRNYYDTRDLLQRLVANDGNLIPEVFFCRRELYAELYEETYSRRFLNTYYLPHLRRLRMLHLPLPLYRYRVHGGSTFSSARGLLDRSKSTQNYINAALFMYSPLNILGGNSQSTVVEQYAAACYQAAELLIALGNRHREGRSYAGAEFTATDRLWWVYYFNAFHWLMQAKLHSDDHRIHDGLQAKILAECDPGEFNPERDAALPGFYRELPWFANKGFNNLGDFIVLDMLTMGAKPPLDQSSYTLWRGGKAHLRAENRIATDIDQAITELESRPITAVNVCDAKYLAPLLTYLIENGRLAVNVMNLAGITIPQLETYRNLFTPEIPIVSFTDYLRWITNVTTRCNYARSVVEAAV